MLRGNNPATVDAKGRLKIPTAFKDYLDEKLGQDYFVTSLKGDCARLYPLPVWRGIEEKLEALPSTNQAKKHYLDSTNYWGQTQRADSQGRVLIPSLLRQSAGLQGEVAVLGYLNYLEVWSMERFREHMEHEPLTDADLEALSNLGI